MSKALPSSFLAVAFVLATVPAASGASSSLVTCGFEVHESIVVGNSLFDCPVDGLIVKAQDITIDLNGFTIDGNGVSDDAGFESGIDNSEGHSGVVVRDGTVTGFERGVEISPPASMNRIVRVQAYGNFDGFVFDGTDHRFRSNTASGNVSNGVRAFGSGHILKANLASGNPADGFNVRSSGHTLEANRALGNGLAGFVLDGISHVLEGNTSSGNGRQGFLFNGNGFIARENKALGDGENGFIILGNAHKLRGNVARANEDDGFIVADTNHTLKRNKAVDNGSDGIEVASGDGHRVIRNKTHRNGFAEGQDDDDGLGIRVDGGVTNLTAKKNKANGNDDPTQCSPNAACN